MLEIHAKDVKELLVEFWQEIQLRRKQFEALKVMTELIKDIQKMQEKEEGKDLQKRMKIKHKKV